MWVTKQTITSKNRNKHDLRNQPKNLMELKRKEETGGSEEEGEGGREEGEREAMTLQVLTFQTIPCISLLKDFRNMLCGCSFVLYSALVPLSSRP